MNKIRQSVCLLLSLDDELTDPGESDMSPLPDLVNPAPSGLAFLRKSLNQDASFHKEKTTVHPLLASLKAQTRVRNDHCLQMISSNSPLYYLQELVAWGISSCFLVFWVFFFLSHYNLLRVKMTLKLPKDAICIHFSRMARVLVSPLSTWHKLRSTEEKEPWLRNAHIKVASR